MDLTLRERQIVRLVSEGFTAVEIGERMGLKPQTIKNIKHGIHSKLGTKNAIQMVRALPEVVQE